MEENIIKLATFVGSLHALALAIVNLTPTPRDDEAMRRFYRLLEIFAGIWLPMAKR